jgi:hypothetical protein
MKLITEYLDHAAHFRKLAGETDDPKLRQQLLEQSDAYWKLAIKRAAQLGVPSAVRPPERESA